MRRPGELLSNTAKVDVGRVLAEDNSLVDACGGADMITQLNLVA